MTTAEKLETSKSLEALRSSFDLTEGLSEDIVLITVRVVGSGLAKVLGEKFRARIEDDAVRCLSMAVTVQVYFNRDRANDVGTALEPVVTPMTFGRMVTSSPIAGGIQRRGIAQESSEAVVRIDWQPKGRRIH